MRFLHPGRRAATVTVGATGQRIDVDAAGVADVDAAVGHALGWRPAPPEAPSDTPGDAADQAGAAEAAPAPAATAASERKRKR